MNTTMKKCTGVWSTWGGEGCFNCSDSPFWFSLFIATEHSIFKSACFTLQLALQCYPSSLFTAEQQWGWCCFEPKKHAMREQESSLDFSNAFALWESSFWEERRDTIRCSFHLARWEMLTRRQSCQVGKPEMPWEVMGCFGSNTEQIIIF